MEQTVLLIVISYKEASYTKQCVESIRASTDLPYRILLIDNASGKETTDVLRTLEGEDLELVLNEKNLGWVGGVNQGLARDGYRYYCVMNNDLIVYPGWLREMVAVAEADAAVGLVNPEWNIPKQFNEDHKRFYEHVMLKRRESSIDTDFARGFCFLIKPQVIAAIGGLGEDFAPGYYDDWDYSMRALVCGYRCARALKGFVHHIKNVSYGVAAVGTKQLLAEKQVVFEKKWGRPSRVIIFDLGGLDAGTLRGLLDRQNRVTVRSRQRPLLRHTNCRWFSVGRFSFFFDCLFVVMNEKRRSVSHRADRLFVVGKGGSFLSWVLRSLGATAVDQRIGCMVPDHDVEENRNGVL